MIDDKDLANETNVSDFSTCTASSSHQRKYDTRVQYGCILVGWCVLTLIGAAAGDITAAVDILSNYCPFLYTIIN